MSDCRRNDDGNNRNTYGHREEAFELAEDHLLTCLCNDGFKKQVRCGSRVQVLEKAIHPGLAEPSELR